MMYDMVIVFLGKYDIVILKGHVLFGRALIGQ